MLNADKWIAAYVDECEAIRSRHLYNMAASLIATEKISQAHEAIRVLTRPGQKKLHWSDKRTAQERMNIAQTIADLQDVEHLVVVLSSTPSTETPKRRRRRCLARLLLELHALGISDVTIEARETKQNHHDLEFLNFLRKQRLITGPFRIRHVPGPQLPLLALADVVAGAIKDYYSGEPIYRKVLSHKINELVI